VRFWDTSALVPLLALEPTTPAVRDTLTDDPEVVVWWATAVECTSALARAERDGGNVDEPLRRLDALTAAWHEVDASDRVRQLAFRLLRVHPLRAADALQLAAAIVASEDEPRTMSFVTLDERLALAASREGFPVIRPA
jgi:predicted nucleic acid-binding protein